MELFNPLPGAEFQVTRTTQDGTTQYLYSNGSGWAWSSDKNQAQTFKSVISAPSGDTSTTNWKSLFEISGLGDGTYTVTETKVPEGYDQSVLPSFQVTVKAGSPETVTPTAASYGLVNNTPGGNVKGCIPPSIPSSQRKNPREGLKASFLTSPTPPLTERPSTGSSPLAPQPEQDLPEQALLVRAQPGPAPLLPAPHTWDPTPRAKTSL